MSWPHYVTFPSIWFTWSKKPIGELERGKETLSNCQLNYVRKMWREIFCSCCLFVFGHRNSGNHSYWHFKLDASCFYLCLEVCFFCGSYYGVHVVAYFSQGNIRCGSDHLCSSSFLSLCLWKKKKIIALRTQVIISARKVASYCLWHTSLWMKNVTASWLIRNPFLPYLHLFQSSCVLSM